MFEKMRTRPVADRLVRRAVRTASAREDWSLLGNFATTRNEVDRRLAPILRRHIGQAHKLRAKEATARNSTVLRILPAEIWIQVLHQVLQMDSREVYWHHPAKFTDLFRNKVFRYRSVCHAFNQWAMLCSRDETKYKPLALYTPHLHDLVIIKCGYIAGYDVHYTCIFHDPRTGWVGWETVSHCSCNGTELPEEFSTLNDLCSRESFRDLCASDRTDISSCVRQHYLAWFEGQGWDNGQVDVIEHDVGHD